MDDFIETPIKPVRVGRVTPMTNKNITPEASKAPKAKYNKTRGEHIKDILIAVLIVGVVAFIGGAHYADSKNAEMQNAVKNAQTTAQAVAPEVKK